MDLFGLDGMGIALIALGVLAILVLFAGAKTVPTKRVACTYRTSPPT